MPSHSFSDTNIFIRWKIKCSIQRGEAELNGTFHLSSNVFAVFLPKAKFSNLGCEKAWVLPLSLVGCFQSMLYKLPPHNNIRRPCICVYRVPFTMHTGGNMFALFNPKKIFQCWLWKNMSFCFVFKSMLNWAWYIYVATFYKAPTCPYH